MESNNSRPRGPKIGTDKAARLASQTVEYAAVRSTADNLGISIQQLCDIAAVPFGTVKAWKVKFPKTYASDEKLARLVAVSLEDVMRTLYPAG